MIHFLPTGSGQEPAAGIPSEYAVGVRARVTTPEGWPVAHPVITLTDRSGVQITRTVGEAHGEAAGPPVPAGTYTLIVTAPGYQPAARTVTLPARVIPFQPETMTLTRSGTAALPELGTWTIDPLHSTINLTAHHLGIGGIRGRFTRFSGRIEIAEPFERSGVLSEIDAASIDTGNDVRDDHLRSANFLEVEAYPTPDRQHRPHRTGHASRAGLDLAVARPRSRNLTTPSPPLTAPARLAKIGTGANRTGPGWRSTHPEGDRSWPFSRSSTSTASPTPCWKSTTSPTRPPAACPLPGRLSRAVARSSTGIVITDVWESGEHLDAFMAQPEFQTALQRVGMPEPEVAVYQIDRRQ